MAWMRAMFFVGCPKVGSEASFRDLINGQIAPALGEMPGVREITVLWFREFDGELPPIYCQLMGRFDRREDIDLMLASPARQPLREKLLAALASFEGHIAHINFEVGRSSRQ